MWQEKGEHSHTGVYCGRNIKSHILWFSLIFSLREVPTKMVSHLQITAAHSAERHCTRKIKIKSRRDQATIKVGYTNSRGRQTMSQEGLHPQAVLPVGSSGLLNYWGFKWEYIGILLITSILLTRKCQNKRRPLDLKSKKPDSSIFCLTWPTPQSLCILTSEMEGGNT